MADGNSVIQSLTAGLTASSLRGRVIASNLANLDTPGFRRRAVEFEKHLAEAMAGGDTADINDVEMNIVRPLNTPLEANGNDVSLDMEVGEMVKNGARYKTYMRTLTKMYRQMESAMQTHG